MKALRPYDDLGLLVPEHVDGSNGYRYYGPSQTPRAEAIRMLSQVDMSLEEIGLVLDSSPEKRDHHITDHLETMKQRLAEQHLKIATLSDLANGREPLVPYEVALRDVPAQHVASITRETSRETIVAAIQSGFETIIGSLTAAGIGPSGAPFLVLHDVIDEENPGRIEICIPVASGFTSQSPVEAKDLAEGVAAATVHKGSYDEIPPAYHAISSWMSANRWEPNGPPREVFLNDPTGIPVSEQITEVIWPIRGTDE